MAEKYTVAYDGAKTRIVETPTGEWSRWNQARVAAIEIIEEVLAEAQSTLDVLRRSGNFFEFTLRRKASGREQESSEVQFVPPRGRGRFLQVGRPSCRC